jgi:hypothetical protein
MLFIFSTPVLIKHLRQFKTIVFLHWCLICALLFLKLPKIKSLILTGEHNIYGRKPKSCLGRVFNFKLGSLTDNTINPLNANGHISSSKLGPGFVLLAKVCPCIN